MTDRDALYAAILSAPDDDTPRLVYADYLDDTGVRADAIRARFIRNQVALARADEWSDEFDRLLRATAPVEFHYHKEWATGLDGIALQDGYQFERGFVAQVTCYSKRFVADGARLFAAQPVRGIKFATFTSTRGAATADELASCPLLARLNSLHLVGKNVHDKFLDSVGKSPHVAGVSRLVLDECQLSPGFFSRLGGACFPGVRELDTRNTVYGPEGAAALARARNLAKLEVLVVAHGVDPTGPPFRGPGAVALAESPHLRGLTELDLRGQELRKKGTEAFLAAYAWPNLRRLGLRGNGVLPTTLPAFAANPLLRSLAVVDLRSNPITRKDLAPLREALPTTRFLTDDAERPINLDRLAPEDRP